MFRCAAFLLAAVALFGLAGAPKAQTFEFSTVANISATMGVVGGRVCLGEASRQDIGCPSYAPSVTTSGLFTATSIATGGLTVTGATSLSTISATIGDFTTLRVNGVPVVGGGGAASPTNVPAFRVHRNGIAQSYPVSTFTKIDFTTEEFDTFNNFDTTNSRFTPTVPGRYIFTSTVVCSTGCYVGITRNGSTSGYDTWGTATASHYAVAVGVFEMNGTTDYVESYVLSGVAGDIMGGASRHAVFSGSLLASGNGLISGSTALGDRITSSTTAAVIANESGGTVSFTLGGTAGAAYLHPTLGLVASGVSATGTISATGIYAANATNASQLRLGTGGFLGSTSSDQIYMSGGMRWNGSAWVATAISTSSVNLYQGGIALTTGSATVPGATPSDIVRLFVTNDGNVGIGTGIPSARLSVVGEVQTASSGAACTAPLAGAIRYTGGNLSYCNGSAWTLIAGASGGTPGGVSGSIQFNSGGSFAGRSDLVVDSNGNIAGRNFASLGDVAGYSFFDRSNSGVGSAIYRDASKTRIWDSSLGDQFIIDNTNGNVGIAVPNPNARLEVDGRVSATVLQLSTDAGGCTTATLGTIRRDPATGRLQHCRM